MSPKTSQEDLKRLVGVAVAEVVEDGMVIGLGTGSTVFYTIKALGTLVKKEGLGIHAVPTSKDTEQKMKKFGIPSIDPNNATCIDLAIDGADEVSKELDLIKGGGGALTREKIIDYMAGKFIVITDKSKVKDCLGGFPIPVETMKFCWKSVEYNLQLLGARVSQRMDKNKKPFVTDNDHYLLDAKFQRILKPVTLEQVINNIPGVIENGLFRHDKVSEIWIGGPGGIEVLEP